MSQSQSSLITSFFKSPASQEEEGNERPVSNGARELSCEDEESCSSVEGGGGARERLAVNLNSLLSGVVGSQKLFNYRPPPLQTTSSGMENGTSSPPTVSSGMKQGTLAWDTSSGTLSLKTALTESSGSEGERQKLGKRRGRARGRGRGEGLVVRVKRRLLCRVPGPPSEVAGLRSEPDSGSEVEVVPSVAPDSGSEVEVVPSVAPDSGSEVEVVPSVAPDSGSEVEVVPSVAGLNESVVVVSVSPPPSSSSSSAPLSGAWARIFGRPVKHGSSSVRPAAEPRSPTHSPRKRGQRSASSSPRRSPRSPRHSARKGTSSTPASPLKTSLLPRQLVPSPKRPRLEWDHAPFFGLVHTRQESASEPFWTLTPTGCGLRPKPPPTPASSSLHSSLASCLTPLDNTEENHTPLLTPVTSVEERASALERLAGAHPDNNVHQIFQRYRRIRRGGGASHASSVALPTSRGRKLRRQPLVCKIHILNGRGSGGVRVNKEVYGVKHRRKRSLHLSRKRNTLPTESSVGEGLIQKGGVATKGEEGGRDTWTELYRPQSSSEVIGNKVKVQQLFSWLESWRNKSVAQADQLSRRPNMSEVNRNEGQRSRESSPTPDWARGGQDFLSLTHLRRRRRRRRPVSSSGSEGESEGEGEGTSSVLLLCGGVGCGKTAAVHACAAELGCKVFEVNASSIRSRGALMATLKEATLSHQVSLQPSVGVATPKTGEGGVKTRKKKKAGSNGLLTFFKREKGQREKTAGDEGEGVQTSSHGRPVSLESSTVILLEEVDVLFDSDRGFWTGVYELAATTRRPIILTCNDCSYDLDCNHLKIVFDTPPLVELGMHIQLLCLSHDCHMTSDKAVQLADCLHADIRRIFLSLQFCVSTPHTLTSLSALSQRRSTPSFPPHQSLPWHTLKPRLLTSDLYRDIDVASHKSEQDSYMDLVSMDTASGGGHMTRDDIIFRPWWRCKEEAAGVLDELPERESQWREEEMEEGVCGKLGRGLRPHHDPISWSQFTRHVQSVRQSLERCSRVFALPSCQVGVATDGLPLLRAICSSENLRRLNPTKRRFRHYLHQCVDVDQKNLENLPLASRFPS